MRKKVVGCMLRKIFCVKIGQNGYQNAQNFILFPNLKMKLRKSGSGFHKNSEKTIVHGSPIFFRGPLSFFLNLCNPGECRKMRSVKNTSESK